VREETSLTCGCTLVVMHAGHTLSHWGNIWNLPVKEALGESVTVLRLLAEDHPIQKSSLDNR
jgi:hypothetical protein